MVHNGSISVQLSKRATSELHSVYTAHTEYNPDLKCESFDLDSLSEEMITLRKNYLEKDPGFVVVDNFLESLPGSVPNKIWIFLHQNVFCNSVKIFILTISKQD